MSKIETSEHQLAYDERFATVIKCAVCDHDYTHQTVVRSYEREVEDGHTRIYEMHRNGKVEDVTHMNVAGDNPSARRHAVGVLFTCEGCASVSELCIAQHKGMTYLYVRPILIDAFVNPQS